MTAADMIPAEASAAALIDEGRGAQPSQLLRGSAYALGSVAAGAATAAVFWLVAARLYPTDEVGRASALFTSLLFVTFVANLGLPVAVARFGSEAPDAYRVVVSWAFVAAAGSAALAGASFILVVPVHVSAPLRAWGLAPGVLLFAALSAGTAMTLVIDTRLMVARQWHWVFWRIAVVGVARIPLLWLTPSAHDAFWVFLVCALPPAISGIGGLAFLHRLTGERLQWGPRPEVARTATRYAGVNYLATLASDAARFALPVLVLLHVTARANASFYVAWGVTMVAFLVPVTIGQVLLAEGSKRAAGDLTQSRIAVALSVAIMGLGSLVAWVFADVIVRLYGSGYRESARILPLLMAAGIPWAVTSICLADARLRRDSRATLAITITMGALVLGPALFLVPAHGIDGATSAWLFGNAAAAAVAAAVTVPAHRKRQTRADLG